MGEPNWTSADLSRELPVIRSQGEGQALEYMATFPAQVRDLGKEIAAFATSGGGRIVIGVDDLGDLCSLADVANTGDRDLLVRRIEGISHGVVKPSLTPRISFATEQGSTVVVVDVPKGSEPVYYCGNIPYVRHLTESRPAEPHEVIQLVTSWLADSGGVQEAFLGRVAIGVRCIIAFTSDIETWEAGPPFDSFLSALRLGTSILRGEAMSDYAVEHEFAEPLNTAADAADRVIHFRRTLGAESRAALGELLTDLHRQAECLEESILRRAPPNRGRCEESRREVRAAVRELQSIQARLPRMLQEGRADEARNDASRIGERLFGEALFGLHDCAPEAAVAIRQLARKLHQLEAFRLNEWDGGASREHLIGTIQECGERLGAVVTSLE